MLNGWNSSVRTTSAMISASTTILTVSTSLFLGRLAGGRLNRAFEAFGSLMDRSSLVEASSALVPRLLYKSASGAPSGGIELGAPPTTKRRERGNFAFAAAAAPIQRGAARGSLSRRLVVDPYCGTLS